MTEFIILRTQREDNPENRAECQVKFFPIKDKDGNLAILETEHPEDALFLAKARIPNLGLFLAVEEKTRYDTTIARIHANRILRSAAAPGNRAKGEDSQRGKSELKRLSHFSERVA